MNNGIVKRGKRQEGIRKQKNKKLNKSLCSKSPFLYETDAWEISERRAFLSNIEKQNREKSLF